MVLVERLSPEPRQRKPRRPEPPPEGVELLRAEHAAWLLSVSVETVYQMAASGTIPFVELDGGSAKTERGRRRLKRYPRAQLLEWVRRSTVKPRP